MINTIAWVCNTIKSARYNSVTHIITIVCARDNYRVLTLLLSLMQ